MSRRFFCRQTVHSLPQPAREGRGTPKKFTVISSKFSVLSSREEQTKMELHFVDWSNQTAVE